VREGAGWDGDAVGQQAGLQDGSICDVMCWAQLLAEVVSVCIGSWLMC
jgi:hypothetical protein